MSCTCITFLHVSAQVDSLDKGHIIVKLHQNIQLLEVPHIYNPCPQHANTRGQSRSEQSCRGISQFTRLAWYAERETIPTAAIWWWHFTQTDNWPAGKRVKVAGEFQSLSAAVRSDTSRPPSLWLWMCFNRLSDYFEVPCVELFSVYVTQLQHPGFKSRGTAVSPVLESN